MGHRWPVIHRVDVEGNRELVPLNGNDGERLGYHRSDYSGLPGEDRIQEAMREGGVKRGYYYLPHCVDFKELAKPEVKEKFEKGPVAFVTVLPNGVPSMGKALISWFIFCLVMGCIVALRR